MKAIHVANTGDSRIYYLLESDNDSTGVVIKRNSPPTFVNFFAYVSKKPQIQRLMDSDFHKFLWTGNKGSLKPRWEHVFIDRVAEPVDLLVGVNVISKFKTDDGPNRVRQMEEKANRAIEYRSLISAGLNEKAFARSVGRMAGRAATGAVRGFRRGIRFDRHAGDGDLDGFVQEGTEWARAATPSRTDLTTQETVGYKQPGRRRFMRDKPPDPTTLFDASREELRDAKSRYYRWKKAEAGVSAHGVGLVDPEELLQSWIDLENELSEAFLDGRPIRTTDDFREVAAQLHSGFGPNLNQRMTIRYDSNGDPVDRKYDISGGSYFDLITPDRKGDEELSLYERYTALAVMRGLRDNPDLQNHTLQIGHEDDLVPSNPVISGGKGVLGQAGGLMGWNWKVNKIALQLLRATTGTREERNKRFSERLDEMLEIDKVPSQRNRHTKPRITIGLRKEKDHGSLTDFEIGLTAEDASKMSHNTATTALVVLSAHLDDVPEGEQAAVVKQGKAIFGATIATHEFSGHGSHTSNIKSFADKDAGGDHNALKRAFERIKEHIGKNPIADKTALDLDSEQIDKTGNGGYNLAHGTFGPRAILGLDKASADLSNQGKIRGVTSIEPDTMGVGQWLGYLDQMEKPGSNRVERLHEWLKQPIMDGDGNPFTATPGLAQYFNALAGEAGLSWPGIDLTISPGEELTLAHVLYGMSPSINFGETQLLSAEANGMGLTRLTDHRKGKYLSYRPRSGTASGANWTDITDKAIFVRVGNGNDTKPLDVIPSGVLDQMPWHMSSGGVELFDQGVLPAPTVLREHGIPAFKFPNTQGSSVDSSGNVSNLSFSDPVSPEDVAPLLDAHAVVNRILADEKSSIPVTPRPVTNLQTAFKDPFNPTDLEQRANKKRLNEEEVKRNQNYLAKLLKVRFNKIKESKSEVGATGLPITELVSNKSPAQRVEVRQRLVDQLLASLIYDHKFVDKNRQGQTARIDRPRGEGGVDAMRDHRLFEEGGPLEEILSNLVSAIVQDGSFWDGLNDTDIDLLKNLSDNLGYRDYGSYSGAHTPHALLDELTGGGRHELVAEFMTLMSTGMDFPIWGPKGRRPLTPAEVTALTRLFKWLSPKGTPKIRSGGINYD
jgi:hypothetical protein